jgi:UDP-galactopyranose mutase
MAERLAAAGQRVCICDRRPHIAGNAYDHYDEHGLLVHAYGPHIFHTNSARIFRYLSRFTSWRPYEHRVLAHVDGKLLPFPINVQTLNTLYGLQLEEQDVEAFYASKAEAVQQVRSFEDACVSRIGRDLYEKFIANYTRKQWGIEPSELDASVLSRIAARTNRDDRYFTDEFQFMPAQGYTRMFQRMLNHPNITVLLQADYHEVESELRYKELIFTGPVDQYFDYCFGKLPYRSLRFEHRTLEQPVAQAGAVINYPNEHDYTRVTEFKYLTGQVHPKTSVVYEYPTADGDPYYPVPRAECAALYRQYKKLADSVPHVHFLGRLGTYRYYNMDQCVAQALAMFERLRQPWMGAESRGATGADSASATAAE